MNALYKELSNELLEINVQLNQANTKINNHLHRKICRRVEQYFYHIVSPLGREKINQELNSNNNISNHKSKIDIYIQIIEEEYPHYFKKIKNEGIDFSSFLYKINYFRKKNNEEFLDKEKVSFNSTIKNLNDYFDNKFDFKKHFDFMDKNFAKFKVFIFDENEVLGEEIYENFQKKEIES